MFYKITLYTSLQDGLIDGRGYQKLQHYTETWSVEEYHVDKHCEPVLDKVLVSSSGTGKGNWVSTLTVVISGPYYIDNPLGSDIEAFKRGKALIIMNPGFPKKSYFGV